MSGYRSFACGLLLTGMATAASLIITFALFRRDWYLGQLLAIFMALYVLVAWVVYTHRHPLGPRRPGVSSIDGQPGAPRKRRFLDTLIPDQGALRSFYQNPVPALLWSAVQLGALTMVLYYVFDVGTHYH